ncbi:MAG: HPr(Ser) kinase/phosphatase [Myxococcales bacterium]|nr:HPr(Ser) kinase/phosphatase [Myxococcales bacterium]
MGATSGGDRDVGHPVGPVTSTARLLEHPAVGALLRVHAGRAGLDRPITHPRVQKNGLPFAGHLRGTVPTRVQVLGETEMSYVLGLESAVRAERAGRLFALHPSCVVVTRGVDPPPELTEAAERSDSPLLVSTARSSETIHAVHSALDELLAPTETRHGVLVEVHGLGVLLVGPSGIGKSECALSLVARGHRLVADDQVILTRFADGRVEGRPPVPLRHHLEIRGIGILNVRELFGATAVRERVAVDLIVRLDEWRPGDEYERLGLDERHEAVLGVGIPVMRLAVTPGRDFGVLVEVAVRDALLRRQGVHAARAFVRGLSRELGFAVGGSETGLDEDPDPAGRSSAAGPRR